MQLIKLKTKNFKRLEKGEFNFTEGLNFILGENGAGKSTLLRAISTALFGVQMLPGLAEDIPTRGQSTWELELTFSHKDVEYVVKRTKSSAKVEADGELVASGNTPTTKYIEDLLNLTAKDYNLLIHSRQGETAYVLNFGATALQRKVEEFAGAEAVELLTKKASLRSRTDAAAAQSLSIMSEDEVTQTTDKMTELGEKLHEMKSELDKAQGESQVTPEPPAVSSATLQAQLNKYKRWEMEVENVQRIRSELEQELSTLPEPQVLTYNPKEELEALQETLKQEEAKVKAYQQATAAHTAAVQALASRAEVYEPQGETKLVVDTTEITNLLQQLKGGLQLKQKELKEGVCPTCGTVSVQDLDTLKADIARLKQHVEKVEGEYATITQSNKEAESHNRVLQRATDSYQEFVQWKEQEEVRISQLADTIGEEPKEPHEIKQRILDLRVQVETAEKIVRDNELLGSKKSRLQKQLEQMTAPEQPCDAPTDAELNQAYELEEEYRTAVARATEAEKMKSLLSSNIQSLQEQITRLESDLTKNSEVSKEKDSLMKIAETANQLGKFLKDRRSDYISQVWDSVMLYATEALNASSNGWMTEVKIEDGKFYFREYGAWVTAVEASGAQEAFLGSALRVGLNKALYRGNAFMVFDEPTDGMREENARSLVAEIGNCAGQVLVITHRESDQGLANNIIEV